MNWANVKLNPYDIQVLRNEIKSYEDACSFEPRSRADLPLNDQLKHLLVKKLWETIEADESVQTEAKVDDIGIDRIRSIVFGNAVVPNKMTREQAENATYKVLTKGQICKLLHSKGAWI